MNTFEKAIQFFWACAPGIAIGLWLAPQLGLWWPVAALAGAVVSYLLVEWKTVVFAIPKAARKASPWLAERLFDGGLWRARGSLMLAWLSVFSSSTLIFLGILWFCSAMFNEPITWLMFISQESMRSFPFAPQLLLTAAHVFFIVVTVLSFAVSAVVFLNLEKKPVTPQLMINRAGDLEFIRDVIKFANPLAVFFYWPARGLWNAPRGIRWFFKDVVWEILLFFGRFFRTMLFIIHSHKRTLCATTTFMTVVLGYVMNGDLITFTLAGAGIGALYSVSSLKDWVVIKVQPQPTPAR